MILIRDVFRPVSFRVMTGLIGPYCTLVLETTAAGFAEYEQESRGAKQDPEWRTLFQTLAPFVESGYRDVFSIVG